MFEKVQDMTLKQLRQHIKDEDKKMIKIYEQEQAKVEELKREVSELQKREVFIEMTEAQANK